MMKGTPCSSRDHAPLKTLGKMRYLARSANPAKRVRAWARVGRRPPSLSVRFCKRQKSRATTYSDRILPFPHPVEAAAERRVRGCIKGPDCADAVCFSRDWREPRPGPAAASGGSAPRADGGD